MVKLYPLLFFILFISNPLWGQQLIDVINKAEKSVMVVRAINTSGSVVQECSGFTISADGIAVVPSSLFLSGDSIVVETRSGSKYGVSKILQVHKQANLSLIKLSLTRGKELSYLIPAKPLFLERQELLVFGHPAEVEDGLDYGVVSNIKYQVFLNRMGMLNIKLSRKSFGAPVVNGKGELVGMVNAFDNLRPAMIIDSKLLNDSNWVGVNMTIRQMVASAKFKGMFGSDYNEALLRLIYNDSENAARLLSNYIKVNPSDATAYAIRAHARYLYKNTYGCREDVATCKKLDPQAYLPYYYDAIHLMGENKKEEALLSLTRCLEIKPNFSFALVEHGRLLITLKNRLEGAYADYLMSIRVDTTYGAGYYEKGRFVLQYLEDKRPAVNDINKAINLDPGLPGVYTIRGTLRIEDQNYLAAINDFNRALEHDPKDASALFNRGIASYNLGRKDNACKDWQKAADLGHYKAVRYMSKYCTGVNRKY
jgi:tetratricopeptide (TPR) repeat protein